MRVLQYGSTRGVCKRGISNNKWLSVVRRRQEKESTRSQQKEAGRERAGDERERGSFIGHHHAHEFVRSKIAGRGKTKIERRGEWKDMQTGTDVGRVGPNHKLFDDRIIEVEGREALMTRWACS